jgi:small-conductance mechanosensitive channel
MDFTTWPAIVGDLFSKLSQGVTDYFPNIFGALALLVVGWIAAKLMRWGTSRLVNRLPRLIPGRVWAREMKSSGIDRMASDVVSTVLFWAVFLFFVAAATEALGLTAVTSGLGRLASYLPSVMAAALVVLAGLVAGNLVKSVISQAAKTANLSYGDGLAKTAKGGVLLLAGVVALDQIGIDSTLLILVTSIVIGVTLGGVALAFGLGARSAVGNIIASHYLHQAYRIGQNIRVGDVIGTIETIQPTYVVIAASEGRVMVPAKQFIETTSVLLSEEPAK